MGCVSAKILTYRARARVSRIRTCQGKSGKPRRFYTRVRITFRVPEDDPGPLRPGRHSFSPLIFCA